MKRKSILFIVSIVLVLTLAFALVACNDNGENPDGNNEVGAIGELPSDDDNSGENNNDDEGDVITELSENMTLDEVKAFSSNVNNVTFSTSVNMGIEQEQVGYVNENCYISVVTMEVEVFGVTIYEATFVEDNRAYNLSRTVYSDELSEDAVEYTWIEIDASETELDNNETIFGESLLDAAIAEVENGNATFCITTKEGIEGYVIVVEGTQHYDDGEFEYDMEYTMTYYDFNKTEMPSIEEYFPNYKELAVEYVEPAEEE